MNAANEAAVQRLNRCTDEIYIHLTDFEKVIVDACRIYVADKGDAT